MPEGKSEIVAAMKPERAASGLISISHRRRGGARRGLLRLCLIAIFGIVLYGLGGAFGAPWLIDRMLSRYEGAAPGSASHGAIRVNPFRLTVAISDIRLASDSTSTGFSATGIALDFSARSLLERRPVASSVVIEQAGISIETLASLGGLVRRARAGALGEARIDRLDMTDGRLDIGSINGNPEAFAAFDLSVTEIDFPADSTGRFRLDALAADGAELVSYGTLSSTLETASGQLSLSGADLAPIGATLGPVVAAASPRGLVGLSAGFAATRLLAAPVIELNEAQFEIANLELRPAAGLSLSGARVDGETSFRIDFANEAPALSGRLAVDQTALLVSDARTSPTQSFALDDTAILITANADNDSLSVNLGGSLEGAGDVTVTVRMPNVAAGTRRVSIRTTNLPAEVLSVYAQGALGRGIAAGDADLETEYALTGERVDGTLTLLTRGLEFAADETAAPDPPGTAAESSLELAAALLEDSDRVVRIELPFAGYALTAREAAAGALRARLAAITETPFDALAPLIAGEAGSAGSVPFQPGDPALSDRALTTIGQLVTALNERPRLGLRVHGGYDAQADRDALARQQIQLHVQLATAGTEGEARTVDYGSARAQDVLDEFAGERLAPEYVAELKSQFACEGAMIPLCRRAYYELIFDALVANEDIAATTLNRLGRFRAASVADALAAQGVARERIEVVTDGGVVASPFGVGLRVELTAATSP
jgi:hypothetical protein